MPAGQTPLNPPDAGRARCAAGGTPRRNIELKARLADPDTARRVATRIATGGPWVERQVDTYFHCATGRLKLRQIEGGSATLIGYLRADESVARASDYRLSTISEGGELLAILSETCGVRVRVSKRRVIFLANNVRIHLDDVDGLGSFIEFEAVQGPANSDAEGQSQLAELCRQFSISQGDIIPHSYSEMLLARS